LSSQTEWFNANFSRFRMNRCQRFGIVLRHLVRLRGKLEGKAIPVLQNKYQIFIR